MLAFRLAEHVEHTTDVFGMLDRMTPEQFEAWHEKDKVEPIGYSGQMLGLLAYLVNAYLSKDEVNPADYMPWIRDEINKPKNKAAKTLLNNLWGRPDGGAR